MSATYDTLQYVDGSGTTQEIALSIANIAQTPAVSLRYTPASHAPGTFEIVWNQPPETGIAIPFKSRCVVYVNRSSSSAGANNSFSGGSILFVGRRTDNASGSAAYNRVTCSITLSDVLWDLAKITYQQAWNQITGGTLGSPTYTPFYWPDVTLFQAFPGVVYSPSPIEGTIDTWQQLEDILNYASSYATGDDAAVFQIGSLGFSPVYRNWFPLRSAKCWEAIVNCLRTHPGVFTEVDYTTVDGSGDPLPTIYFRDRGSMTGLTLPYKSTDANGIVHVASEPQALSDLIPDNVRLYYRKNGTFNGQPVSEPATDFYPTGDNALLNQDFSIDVTGNSQTETIKNFTSTAFDPTQKTLWREKVPALHQISQGGQIVNDGSGGDLQFVSTAAYNAGTNPKGIQVLGDNGTDYSTNHGTVFGYTTDDEIMSWYQLASGTINVQKCTVKAYFNYSKQSSVGGSTVTDQIQEHQHTFRCVLCSIPSDVYKLSQVTAVGEAIPTGLAQALWTEQQVLQWKFRHQIFQIAADNTHVPTIVKPGLHKINLDGGSSLWETMDAVPQRVQITFARVRVDGDFVLAAHTQIECGPVDHLNPDVLIQLANVFWNRDRARIDANSRLDGSTASSQVDLSSTSTAKENSVPSLELPAENNNVATSGGSVSGQTIQSAPMVAAIVAGKTPVGSSSGMKTMQPREMACCASDGTVFMAAIQSTEGHV